MKNKAATKRVLSIAGQHIGLIVTDRTLSAYLDTEYECAAAGETLFDVTVARQSDGYLLSSGAMEHPFKYVPDPRYSECKFVDFVIGSYIAARLLDKNILFIHGSSFGKNGNGYVCCGMSGSGKSTILQSVPGRSIYSDDTAIIKKQGRRYWLYPSPFDKKLASHTAGPVMLRHVFLLEQAKENREVPVDFLVPFLFFSNYEAYTYAVRHFGLSPQTRLLRNIQLFLHSVTVRKLLFRKDYRAYENVE